jgi:hypothetical protein
MKSGVSIASNFGMRTHVYIVIVTSIMRGVSVVLIPSDIRMSSGGCIASTIFIRAAACRASVNGMGRHLYSQYYRLESKRLYNQRYKREDNYKKSSTIGHRTEV